MTCGQPLIADKGELRDQAVDPPLLDERPAADALRGKLERCGTWR